MSDPVIVTCALTGAIANKKQCPAIPYTPEEYAREAKRAVDAGASVVHLHAREADGSPTWRWEVFRDIREAILAETDVIINFATGGLGAATERIDHVRHLSPDMGALNMGSMNYAKYSRDRKDFVFEFVFANPFSDILMYLRAMKAAGVKPELECFDVGHTNSHEPLVDLGLLEGPIQFSFIMGVLGGLKATSENLACQARQIPKGSTWEVIGISHQQWEMIAAALALGGNIRVGLEDHLYVEPGRMATSNGELVEKAVRMARDAGRRVVGPDEAAQLLGLARGRPFRNAVERKKGTLMIAPAAP